MKPSVALVLSLLSSALVLTPTTWADEPWYGCGYIDTLQSEPQTQVQDKDAYIVNVDCQLKCPLSTGQYATKLPQIEIPFSIIKQQVKGHMTRRKDDAVRRAAQFKRQSRMRLNVRRASPYVCFEFKKVSADPCAEGADVDAAYAAVEYGKSYGTTFDDNGTFKERNPIDRLFGTPALKAMMKDLGREGEDFKGCLPYYPIGG